MGLQCKVPRMEISVDFLEADIPAFTSWGTFSKLVSCLKNMVDSSIYLRGFFVRVK